nr:Hint domain-containing protein [uncultured Rhodopila sp.]
MATYTWNNGTLGAWTEPANWTPSGFPAAGDDAAIILSSQTAYTVTEDYTGTIANLQVGSKATGGTNVTLNFADSADLTVSGTVSNEGTIVLSTTDALSFGSMLNDSLVVLQGGTLTGPLMDNGTIRGFGTIDGVIAGGGYVNAAGGILSLTGFFATSGVGFDISQGATLQVTQSTDPNTIFSFTGTAGELEVPTSFDGIIDRMNVGDSATVPTTRLDIDSFLTRGTIIGTSLDLYNGTTLVASENLSHTYPQSPFVIIDHVGPNDTDVFFSSTAPCYAEGTAILTADGEKNVEDLRERDQVIVLTGGEQSPRPVKWIGHSVIDLAHHPRPDLAAPIRIMQDAIGPGRPHRDLLVSPDHCLFIDGRLIPAALLVNDMSIVQENSLSSIKYFHVELDRHAILLAEGLAAESYLDTGNRSRFGNAGLFVFPEPEPPIGGTSRKRQQDACAPFATDAETVRPIWQRFAAAAQVLGFQPRVVVTNSGPDLRVGIANETILPVAQAGGRYSFVLRAGTRRITLLSRATRPSEIHRYLEDRRSLGVAVASVTLRTGTDLIAFPADHLPARDGWHGAEAMADCRWRWTDGAGVLEFDPLPEAAVMEVRLAGTAIYVVEERPARLAA